MSKIKYFFVLNSFSHFHGQAKGINQILDQICLILIPIDPKIANFPITLFTRYSGRLIIQGQIHLLCFGSILRKM